MIILLLLLSLLDPAPAAPNGWLAWGLRIGEYEVWAGNVRCAVIKGHRRDNGTWVNPYPAYWPRPGDGPGKDPGPPCWQPGQAAVYRIRACTDGICGPFSPGVDFAQDFRCFNRETEIDCVTNQPRGAS